MENVAAQDGTPTLAVTLAILREKPVPSLLNQQTAILSLASLAVVLLVIHEAKKLYPGLYDLKDHQFER